MIPLPAKFMNTSWFLVNVFKQINAKKNKAVKNKYLLAPASIAIETVI